MSMTEMRVWMQKGNGVVLTTRGAMKQNLQSQLGTTTKARNKPEGRWCAISSSTSASIILDYY